MEQRFLEFVAGVMDVPSEELTMDTAYKDYAPWDSLMFMRLVMELEDEYCISIPMEEFESIRTLGDFFGMISND